MLWIAFLGGPASLVWPRGTLLPLGGNSRARVLTTGRNRGDRGRGHCGDRLAGLGRECATASGPEPLYLFGIPVDFILFALTLLGVALFHHHTLAVALTGLAAITLYKLIFTGFKFGAGLAGLALHMQHEWVILANLFLLLMGFALLSRHFEKSRVPDEMPAYLPDDWKGAFVLLVIVFVLSSFLDNIAAALIGGTMARHVFRGKVHIGYLAAIVAASNAGGSGSVVGDTTTTMMWIDGVSPLTRAGGLRRGERCDGDLRHSGGAPAAPLLADRQGCAGGPAHRMDARRHRGGDPRSSRSWPTSSPICDFPRCST